MKRGASQKSSEESRLFSGKENYDQIGFADQLQKKHAAVACNQ